MWCTPQQLTKRGRQTDMVEPEVFEARRGVALKHLLIAVAVPVTLWLGQPPPLLAEAARDCPEAVRAQIDALYRWQLERQEQAGPIAIASQRHRFTARLFALLEQAYSLRPENGRFVDFDVFSGTQVDTTAATLEQCDQERSGRLTAWVAVQAGLRGRMAEPPQRLRYILRQIPGEGWRIADIIYPQEPSFRLTTYLHELLDEPR